MKKAIVLRLALVVSILLTAGVASEAGVNWTRAAVDGAGNWSDSANWDAVPAAGTDYSYTAGAADLSEIQVTGSQTYGLRLVHGSTAVGTESSVLRIMNGGTLSQDSASTGSHSYVGQYNTAKMVIEAGGTFSTNAKLYIGVYTGSVGTVDVYGTLDLSQGRGNLLLGESGATGQGFLNVYDGGVVLLSTFQDTFKGMQYKSFGAGSMIDIQGSGIIKCAADKLSHALDAISYGQIAGNGIIGNVVASYDADLDETYIIVNPTPAARDLYPGDGESVPAANPLALSWTIPSAYDSNDVYAKVWIGTDPLALTDSSYLSPVTTVPANGLDVTTADIDGSDEDTYYWRVNLYIDSESDPCVIGDVMTFNTVDDLPPTVSIETVDTMTWSDEAVSVVATINDDAVSALTFGWTAEPDGIGDPDLNIDIDIVTNGVEDPIIKIINTTGSMVPVTLTLTAEDGAGIVEGSVVIEVYNDVCHMSLVGGLVAHKATDFNWDCTTNLLDFAEIAAEWLNGYTSVTGPVAK